VRAEESKLWWIFRLMVAMRPTQEMSDWHLYSLFVCDGLAFNVVFDGNDVNSFEVFVVFVYFFICEEFGRVHELKRSQ